MVRLTTTLSLLLLTASAFAQGLFTNQRTTLLPTPNYSGVAMGVADLNGDGLDDIVRLTDNNGSPEFALQQPDGSFITIDPGLLENIDVWGLCIADVDNDGLNDIALGSAWGGTHLLRTSVSGVIPAWTLDDMPDTEFQQGSNFVDIDNDGLIDHFACDDLALCVPSRNTGNGVFVEDYSLINPISTVPSDNSGNYASVWTDFDDDGDQDLYLSKCRLGVENENDGRRLNQLFRNDGNGFTDVAEAQGLLPRAQCWATDFADVDNDGDLDAFLVNHDKLSQLMINDGNGNYTDATAAWGMTPSLTAASGSGLGIQCNFEDFDNNGYIDLMVTSNLGLAYAYLNTGAESFSLYSGNALITEVSEQIFQSFATGDLNNDGYIDLYTGHAAGFNSPSSVPDGLLINNGGTNGFLTVQLAGMSSNKMGVGAKIKIYGTWGVQTREVRSGESYGVSNSLTSYFGLGTDATIDRLVVRWPSGLEEEMFNVPANSHLVITEGTLSATLPLEWKSLQASALADKTVRIDWTTRNEEATSHFIVERRTSTGWLPLGQLPAKNTSGEHDYASLDYGALPGDNVYRVRQIDLTGAESISPLAVATLGDTGFSLSPNPAVNSVRIGGLNDFSAIMTLEGLDGRVVRSFSGPDLQLNDVPAGVYLVRHGSQVRKLVVR